MVPYIGGKKQHSKWIDPLFPTDFSTYVEVFGGAMWMYWQSAKTPVQTNVYNDFNRKLMYFFVHQLIQKDIIKFYKFIIKMSVMLRSLSNIVMKYSKFTILNLPYQIMIWQPSICFYKLSFLLVV